MRYLLLISLLFSCLIVYAQDFTLNGDAVDLGDDCFQLTDAVNTQNGTVWFNETLDLEESFSIEFSMFYGSNDGGADGMVFVLQNEGPNALGVSGQGIGFSGFQPSVGIEFDTYQNGGLADPFDDHIALQLNGNVDHSSPDNLVGPMLARSDLFNIEDGQDHNVRITWKACVDTLAMYFDEELRFETQMDFNSIFGVNPSVFWGFTGATGGLSNVQSVCLSPPSFEVPSEDYFMCNGSAIELGSPAELDVLWTPDTFLSDPSSPTPICSATEDITYTVTYTALCGEEQEFIVNVEVGELELNVLGPTTLSCDIQEVALVATTNLFGADVVWTDANGNEIEPFLPPITILDELGVYTVSATFEGQCLTTQTIEVVGDYETYPITGEELVTYNCYNDTPILSVEVDGPDPDFSWGNENGTVLGNDSEVTVSEPGLYTVTVTNLNNGCTSNFVTEVVDSLYYPEILIFEPDTLSCEKPSVTVSTIVTNAGDSFSFNWTVPSEEVDASNLVWDTSSEGIYSITVTNPDNGCTSDDLIIVHADDDFYYDFSSMTMPNVFTPNDDDLNVYLEAFFRNASNIDLEDEIASVDLLVFDRWGKQIFQSSSKNRWWNGEKDEEIVSEGTYYFTVEIEYDCSRRDNFVDSGFVTIQR